MGNLILLAPYYVNRQQGVIRVKTVKVTAKLSWNEYFKYEYLSGIGVKLNHIHRHNCGGVESAIEQLERAQRLINFMDVTGCKPIATNFCPCSHQGIKLLSDPDHLTHWEGLEGEPITLVEPYTPLDDINEEISKRRLTAFVMPHPGIYSGGQGQTTSVLLTTPSNEVFLKTLSVINWTQQVRKVNDINWFEALKLGKRGQS
jgi:hypothetical protein